MNIIALAGLSSFWQNPWFWVTVYGVGLLIGLGWCAYDYGKCSVLKDKDNPWMVAHRSLTGYVCWYEFAWWRFMYPVIWPIFLPCFGLVELWFYISERGYNSAIAEQEAKKEEEALAKAQKEAEERARQELERELG